MAISVNHSQNSNNGIVFIDPTVTDYQSLIDGVTPGNEVVVLDSNRDGVLAIAQALQGRSNITSVHIVSHGSPGCLYLGNAQLSLDTFNRYATQLQKWDVANLFLYGCNVAAGDAGAEFLAKLRQLTRANIAASKTPTGNSALGGNWQLEVVLGQKQPLLAFSPSVMAAYKGMFATNDFAQPTQYIFGFSNSSQTPRINLTFSDTTTSTITATDSGWVSAASNGSFFYDNNNTNFLSGFVGQEYRNYFLFDIASLIGKTVTSATVTFSTSFDTTTPHLSELYELFDFDESFYQNGGLVGSGQPIHDDLITGQKYSASPYTFNEFSDNQSFSLALSTGAITDLNQAISKGDSLFGTGGAVTTLSGLNLNDAPTVANTITAQTASAYTPFNFQFADNTFNDVDGDTLTYTATLDNGSPLPDWLSFDAATRTFNGLPTANDVVNLNIKITANDGNGGITSDTFALNVGLPQNSTTNTIEGTGINDTLRGGAANDLVNGGAGNDNLYGNAGDDNLNGGDGDDILRGGIGQDILNGANGNDTLYGEDNNDTLIGGSGIDFLRGGAGSDILDGGADSDTLFGDAGNDTLYGGGGIDFLRGGDGNDSLYAGAGDDTLYGDAGDDLLNGGLGNDSLWGGTGIDTFILASGQGTDLIRDFIDGQDLLSLSGGLTFAQLTITQTGLDTSVSITSTGEALAKLTGIQASLITAADFA